MLVAARPPAHSRDMRRAALMLIVFAVTMALTAPLAAQYGELARLRAAVDGAPDEPRPRCELAYALTRAGLHREAVDAATVAIDALRPRGDAASRRVLGACLYNRGRAHEALGATALAIADYADSLDVRPNEIVAGRMAALAPHAPASLVGYAATVDAFEFGEDVAVVTARARDGTRWSFVASGRLEEPNVVAVTRLCGRPRAAIVTQAYFDNHGALEVESATPRLLGDVEAIVVRVRGTGDATCGGTEGVYDAEHEATAVVFAEGCEIRVASFVTSAFVCDRRPRGLAVRFDAGGNAITTRRAGHDAPDSHIGTFRIRDVAARGDGRP